MAIQPRTARTHDAPQPTTVGSGMGDAGFGRFLDEHLERIYAFVARRHEERPVAEELTTIAFERAHQVAESGAVDAPSLAAFALKVAASAVVDRARRARRPIPPGVRARDFDSRGDEAAAEAASDEAAVRVLATAIDGDRLRRAVLGLPEPHQRIIVLVYLDALAASEVATVLGCPEEDVALRLHRALRAMLDATREASTDAA